MRRSDADRRRWLLDLDEGDRKTFLAMLDKSELQRLRQAWFLWARPEQRPPPEVDWHTWLVCAGRGFGKTRAGAEWVREIARQQPDARIALIAASLADGRSVMVEGESGILACSPERERPHFQPSLGRLEWNTGATAQIYSAGEPESLRGPQFSHAWADEIGKWTQSGDRAQQAWNNLAMSIRLGSRPQLIATTTPRAVPLVRDLFDRAASDKGLVISRGTTYDNIANLPPGFTSAMWQRFGTTALGRQELHGELLQDIEGALWSRALLERCRDRHTAPEICRIVIGVDPPASVSGDACGIIVAGIDEPGTGFVLADCSVEKPSPEKWARAVADAARIWNADRVVAEANQGGAMVESVLRAAEISLPVKLVHASRGKAARAEPVAALYEAGRVRHAEMFGALEDELCGLMVGGAYEGPGRSPDRADALVWALTELMLGKKWRPKVRQV